jgi:hypothetical protein
MTRAELLELLQVERFLPLPPAPKAGAPAETPAEAFTVLTGDTRAEQYRRRTELKQAIRGEDHNGAPLTKRGLIYVKGDAA